MRKIFKIIVAFILCISLVASFFVDVFAETNIDLSKDYPYEQMGSDIKVLSEAYKEILKSKVIGTSCDKRDIWLLTLGKGDLKIIMIGGVHARETANTAVLMKIIEEYCKAYNSDGKIGDYKVKDILDKTTFYIVPLVNPDGYTLATKGIDVIKDPELKKSLKNMKGSYSNWKANARGVDSNRNFPSIYWNQWKGQRSSLYSSKPAAEFYSGPSVNSEPETKAIVQLFKSIDFQALLDFHSRGNYIYWHRYFQDDAYNKLQKEVAEIIKKQTGYVMEVPSVEKIDGTNGTTVDYASETFKKVAITIETMPYNVTFPVKRSLVPDVYNKIKTVPLAVAVKMQSVVQSNFYPYKVYQGKRFLNDFRLEKDAIAYAKNYANSYVKINDKVVWEFPKK